MTSSQKTVATAALLFLSVLLGTSIVQAQAPPAEYTGFTSSNNAPAMIYFSKLNTLFIFFRDSNGALQQISVVPGSGSPGWGNQRNVNSLQTSAGPGACVSADGNYIHLFYRDPNGNGIFHLVSDSTLAFTAANPYYINQDMDNAPQAAVSTGANFNGRIVVVGSDAGGSAVMYSTLNSDGSIVGVGNTGFDQNTPPTITYFPHTQTWNVFFQAQGGNTLYWITSTDGLSWTGPVSSTAAFTTVNSPASVVQYISGGSYGRASYGMHLAYVQSSSNGNYVLAAHTNDGSIWTSESLCSTPFYVDNTAITMASMDYYLMVAGVHDGQIWVCEYEFWVPYPPSR